MRALRAGQMPEVYRDRRGTHYMVTQGGNKVAVTVDKQGRAFFVDKAGDLYYDSGNPKVGFYVVRCLPAEAGQGVHQAPGWHAMLACRWAGRAGGRRGYRLKQGPCSVLGRAPRAQDRP